MDKMCVAIIDQGVDFGYHRLLTHGMGEEIAIHDESDPDSFNDLCCIAHGTNVASIIHHNSPQSRVVSIKLVARKITVTLLCRALDYIATRDDILIINISLGIVISSPPENLRLACLKCYASGKIIIAAAHYNLEAYCYPAAFPFVIGVGTGIVRMANEFCYLGSGYINVLAKGIHQRIVGENGMPTIRGGTSYATAAFSGILADIFSKNPLRKLEPLQQVLHAYSSWARSTHYPMQKEFMKNSLSISKDVFGGNVMVFPVDDVNIQHLFTDSRVVMIMNYPMDPRNEYGPIASASGKKVIPGIFSPKLCEFIDTLVIGNFFQTNNLINIFFGYALIDFFKSSNVKIETTDPYVQTILAVRGTEDCSMDMDAYHKFCQY